MSNRHVRSRGSIWSSATAATFLVGGVLLLTVALIPGALAEPLNPAQESGGDFGLGETFDSLGLGDMSLGLAVGLTITAAAIAAALAFIGGTKYVNAQNVLENEARRSIFEYIQEHPGAHLRATASALDLSTTNVLWHLRKLESARLVSSKKFEGYKVFYPVEGGVESRNRALGSSVLRNDNAQQILDYCLGQPSAHQREIARALGVNHGTIRWHLRKLKDAGLVTPVKEGNSTAYYVTDLGVDLLADRGNATAKAHLAGAKRAPGAAVAAPQVPGETAHPLVRGSAGPATTPSPAFGPDPEED